MSSSAAMPPTGSDEASSAANTGDPPALCSFVTPAPAPCLLPLLPLLLPLPTVLLQPPPTTTAFLSPPLIGALGPDPAGLLASPCCPLSSPPLLLPLPLLLLLAPLGLNTTPALLALLLLLLQGTSKGRMNSLVSPLGCRSVLDTRTAAKNCSSRDRSDNTSGRA